MRTTLVALGCLVSSLVSGCVTTELAEGEQAWELELRSISFDGDPVPACPVVEQALELRVLYGDAGQLLAIYTPGTDQRFNEYRLVEERDTGDVTLEAARAVSTTVTERWRFDLSPFSDDEPRGPEPRAMLGAAMQELVVAGSGATTCHNAYLVKANVYGY